MTSSATADLTAGTGPHGAWSRRAARRLVLLAGALAAPLAVAAQPVPPIPESLREGWGFGDDIRDFGESLAGGYELSERDVDCDGAPEVLLEWLAARGATGHGGHFLFDRGASGYRYLGRVERIWSVIDYGPSGGCYLASFSRGGAGSFTLVLRSVAAGALEPLGRLELAAGDAGSDDDNALLSALRTGGLDEERLLRLAAVSRLRPIEAGSFRPPPWVERSSVVEVVATVEGYGPQVFERVRPTQVEAADPDPLWSPVSKRAARAWAGAVEEALAAGALDDRPGWLPPAGAEGLTVLGARVEEAVRLNLPFGRSPVGVAVGRFDAELRWPAGEPARPVGITWAVAVATTRLGEAEGVLRLWLGTSGDGESRRLFRLERLTNLDHDRELEVVIEEEAYAGRVQWLLDLSDPDALDVRRLHAEAWD